MPTPLEFIDAHVNASPIDTESGDHDMMQAALQYYEQEASRAASRRVLQRLRAEYGRPGADA